MINVLFNYTLKMIIPITKTSGLEVVDMIYLYLYVYVYKATDVINHDDVTFSS